MNAPDPHRMEAELQQLTPARPPAEFMARLRAARPTAPSHRPRQRQGFAGSSLWFQILPWLAPAAAVAVLAAMAVWRRGETPASTPRQPPAVAVNPAFKADNIRVERELVGEFDAVARLPDGAPVRFRCQKWVDQVVLRDPERGVLIEHRSPRLEVVPVRFETY